MSKTNSILAATFLTLVLAFPSLGGIMGSPGATPPPPPPPTSEESGNFGTPSSHAAGDLSSQTLIDILIAAISWF